MSTSFKISSIEKPIGLGPLESVYSIIVNYEFDPGKPLRTRKEKIQLLLQDAYVYAFAEGNINQLPYNKKLNARIAHFVTKQLQELLKTTNPESNQTITINDNDERELMEIDPERVSFGDWVQIESENIRKKRQIFISCGQRTNEELELGKMISALVKDKTGLDGYFAEYQTSLESLTANIFNAIYESVAFISIMHKRDLINPEKAQYRGSVWIEQEISIASFIVQSLQIPLPSKSYIEKGIIQEGVRGYIIFNPIEFSSNQEIIDDLESWLPSLIHKNK